MHVIPDKALNLRPTLPALPARQQGAVAVIVALSLVGLIGIVGLALDLGKLFVAKSELQNSADACALAAARELTGANTHQLKLAAAAGIATGQRHQVLFQGEQIVVERVTFSDHLTGVYQSAFEGTGALGMRFVRCEVNRSEIANWFVQVLNLLPGTDIGAQTVAASAVATLAPSQITSCAIPVTICGDKVPESTPIGTWLESVIGPPKGGKGNNQGGNLTGNFMWADIAPDGGGGGAAKLSEQLTGPGVCNLPVLGEEVGDTGVISSLAAAWNSRFGIYHGNVKKGDSAPDHSGYAYTETSWPSKFDAFSDFISQRAVNAPFQGNAATGLTILGLPAEGSAYLKEHGADRRLATAAVVDCDVLETQNKSPIESWACVLLLHPINNSQGGSGTRMYLEYLGRSNDPNSLCATDGVPSGPGGAGPLVPALVR